MDMLLFSIGLHFSIWCLIDKNPGVRGYTHPTFSFTSTLYLPSLPLFRADQLSSTPVIPSCYHITKVCRVLVLLEVVRISLVVRQLGRDKATRQVSVDHIF